MLVFVPEMTSRYLSYPTKCSIEKNNELINSTSRVTQIAAISWSGNIIMFGSVTGQCMGLI